MILSYFPRRSIAVGGWLLLASAVLAVGCTTQPPATLKIASADRTFDKTFTAAYFSHLDGGDSDIVLLDHAAEAALDGHPDNTPIRQVMRIRVLWNAGRELKADHNASSNATLHWYVLGNTPETANDVIEYSGTGLAILEDDDSHTLCSVRGAAMKLVARRGTLNDPIGNASITGKIRAFQDGARARKALAEVRSTIIADAAQSDPASRKPLADKTSTMAQ